MRGEQISLRADQKALCVSPPLARGTDPQWSTNCQCLRITPACAGNSAAARSRRRVGQDHPRLRGEQLPRGKLALLGAGSPPLARGTESSARAFFSPSRITPACAGNRDWKNPRKWRTKDHPRLRGEQLILIRSWYLIQGSPPLARGTDKGDKGNNSPRRITPACAGNRLSGTYRAGLSRDHPRLRGEQQAARRVIPSLQGSPPLARGTVAPYPFFKVGAGITPACAGNSPLGRDTSSGPRDHPRLRGEQCFSPGRLAAGIGSPPLARGTVALSL